MTVLKRKVETELLFVFEAKERLGEVGDMETNQESEEEPKFGDLTCKDFYNLSRHFVRKYYQTLHSAPNFLYKFYAEKGRLCHLKSEETIIKYFVGIRVTIFGN